MNSPNSPTSTNSDLIWVDTDTLRRYIACNESIENIFGEYDGKNIIKYNNLLCDHESCGLHPRNSRKGKIISQSFYSALLDSIRSEFDSARNSQKKIALSHCEINTSKNLFCELCKNDYVNALSQKIITMERLRYIFDAFDPKESDILPQTFLVDGDHNEATDDCVFAVSRKFASQLRSNVVNIMKTSNNVANLKVENGNEFVTTNDSVAEGLDSIDFSRVFGEEPINANITCKTTDDRAVPIMIG